MRKDDAMQTVQIELPEQLYKSVNALVKNGWFKDKLWPAFFLPKLFLQKECYTIEALRIQGKRYEVSNLTQSRRDHRANSSWN